MAGNKHAFKMKYNTSTFPFKDFPKGAGVHAHKNSDGTMTYHGKSRTTGKKSTYEVTKGDDGIDVLKKNPTSTFGTNKFDE